MDSREQLVMNLLAADDRQVIDGRTRLQKLVFLAQKESQQDLPSEYNFDPYDYGPFSAQLLHDLDDLKQKRWVDEAIEPLPNGKKYRYELTPLGKEQLDDGTEEADKIQEAAEDIVGTFNDMPISRLLEHVYNKYPKYAENSVIK